MSERLSKLHKDQLENATKISHFKLEVTSFPSFSL